MENLTSEQKKLLLLADLFRLISLGLEEMDWKNQSIFFDTLKDFLKNSFFDGDIQNKKFQKEWEFLKKLLYYEESNLESEYHRLFNTNQGISFSEGSYVNIEKGNLIGNIMGFYRAVDFPFITEKHGSPDSIKVELGFLSFLFLKEFFLLTDVSLSSEEKKEKLEILKDLRDKFYNEHIIVWVPEFINLLTVSTNHEFYLNLIIVLQNLIENYSGYIKN